MADSSETLQEQLDRLSSDVPRELCKMLAEVRLHLDTIERHCRLIEKTLEDFANLAQKAVLVDELD